MSDDRRDETGQSWGRVGPDDPTADPATRPAMKLPDGGDERSEQPTVAVPADEGRSGTETTAPTRRKVKNTRTGGLWAALIVSAIVFLFLLVFILQNTDPVSVNFFWLTGTLPTGAALLLAAILGILLVAIPGTGRIMQLRRQARRD